MLKSYFIMAWRSLVKNKVSSIINIGGLSVGLATGILIMLVMVDEFSYDTYNANYKDIHLVMKNELVNHDFITGDNTPGPLAAVLRAGIPEIKYVARVSQASAELLRTGDKSIYANGIYAEPDYFKMMSFQTLAGDPVSALKDPHSIILTQSAASKFFGTENAMGQVLQHNNAEGLKVAAIIRDPPGNSSIGFEVVLPFGLLEQQGEWVKNWDDNRIGTWIQRYPNASIAALDQKLTSIYQAQRKDSTQLFAYPLSRVRLYSSFKNGKPHGGIIDVLTGLGIIGGFVLLIACINFMNLATARSERRAREVGVRKVMGASRKLIIVQFMVEALLLSMLALALGILIACLLLPAFMTLTGKHFEPDFFNWKIWTLLLSLGLLTGVIAGSYPAFYLSRFQPVRVLKGTISRDHRGGLLRKGLVTFQFTVSIFLIIGTIVIFRQIDYVKSRPIGYDADNLIDIPARGDMSSTFDVLKNDLMATSGVVSVSGGTDNLVGFGGAFNGLDWPGKTADQDFYITSTYVQYDWIRTAGLQLAEGRDFSKDYPADSLSCLINEVAAGRMSLKNPIGTKLGSNTVVGVIKDFSYNNPSSAPAPLIVFLGRNSSHFLVRVSNDVQWDKRIAAIEQVVKKSNPNFPFEYHFINQEYEKRFDKLNSVGLMANVFGGMAIFISCLGLFGLSAFLAERRSKELSIRKVLGATASALWFSLSKDFLKPVLLAFVIAVPLAAWLMNLMLQGIDYRIHLSWWMFALAGAMAMAIAVLTISFNGVRAARANPVKQLKSE